LAAGSSTHSKKLDIPDIQIGRERLCGWVGISLPLTLNGTERLLSIDRQLRIFEALRKFTAFAA
jgi:hypothetical protein